MQPSTFGETTCKRCCLKYATSLKFSRQYISNKVDNILKSSWRNSLFSKKNYLRVFLKDFAKLKLSVLILWKFRNTIFTFQWLLLQLKESIAIQHTIEKGNCRKSGRKPSYVSEITVVFQNFYLLSTS